MSVNALSAKLAAFFTFLTSLPFASATFTVTRCCTLAVRSEFEKYSADHYPWTVCNLSKDIDYASSETFLSIMKPMSWAKQFCRGTQYSNLQQWLQPLAAYISPYIGLLLLCPIGEEGPGKSGSFLHALSVWMEYLNILGDPASAVFGAATEIYADKTALSNASSLTPKLRSARWIAALAGALRFSPETDWRPIAEHRRNRDTPWQKGRGPPSAPARSTFPLWAMELTLRPPRRKAKGRKGDCPRNHLLHSSLHFLRLGHPHPRRAHARRDRRDILRRLFEKGGQGHGPGSRLLRLVQLDSRPGRGGELLCHGLVAGGGAVRIQQRDAP